MVWLFGVIGVGYDVLGNCIIWLRIVYGMDVMLGSCGSGGRFGMLGSGLFGLVLMFSSECVLRLVVIYRFV